MGDFVACYKSGHRSVTEAWTAYGDERRRFSDELGLLTDELWPDAVGGQKCEPLVAVGPWDPSERKLIGWSWAWGVEPPEGWKVVNGRERFINPKRSSKVGKLVAKRVDAVSPVRRLDLPGMPLWILDLPSTHTPALEFHGGCLYVGWGVDPEKVDVRSTPGGKNVDLSLWKRIKVSEFFAAREDDEERVEASA